MYENDFRLYRGAVAVDLNDLYHHGILGQKWGKQNGPPYPLGSGDHSAREKKAGWRKSLNSTSSGSNSAKASSKKVVVKPISNTKKNNTPKLGKLTEQQKQALKTVAVIAAVNAAFIGYMYLDNSGAIDRGAAIASDFLSSNYKNGVLAAARMHDLTSEQYRTARQLFDAGFKQYSGKETFESSLRKINPHFLTPGGQKNCVSCSIASVLRDKFGADVTAVKNTKGENIRVVLSDILKNRSTNMFNTTIDQKTLYAFKKTALLDSPKVAAERLILSKFKEPGSQGICTVTWRGLNFGHAFCWKNVGGQIMFYDPQRGTSSFVDKADFFKHMDIDRDFVIARLDNADFDINKLRSYIRAA